MLLSHWLTPPRIDRPELLDLGESPTADVRASLDDLRRMNRYLVGTYSVTRHLYPRMAATTGPLTIVDLGSGSAQLSQAITNWGSKNGRPVTVYAVDIMAEHLHIARTYTGDNPCIRHIQADVTELPFADNGVDFVVSSLLLHHFPPGQVSFLMRRAYELARRGIVLSDLIRSRLPMLAFPLLMPLFARSEITRHDGVISLQRAYIPAEFRQLATEAGLPNFELHTVFFWRMTLVADK